MLKSFLLILVAVLCIPSVCSALTVDEVNAAIKAKGANWIAGETSVTKMPIEESKKLTSLRIGELTGNYSRYKATLIPSALDWRNNSGNFVTGVRDQQSCGACWAFSSTATLESKVLIVNNLSGTDLNLSEQALIACDVSNSGCNGGSLRIAGDFLKSTGIPEESCYSYLGNDGVCGNACTNWQQKTYKVVDYVVVTTVGNPRALSDLKSAIFIYGPIAAGFYAYEDFHAYRSGVYSHVTGQLTGGHGVLVYGYDDSIQAFLCKNSWGTFWGENGYFKIAYSEVDSGTVQFGIESIAYQGATIPGQPIPNKPSSPKNLRSVE